MEQKLDSNLLSRAIPLDRSTGYLVAKWVSGIFSPPLLVVLGLAMAASTMESIQAWLWSGFYILLVVLVPVAYILREVHRGEITDFHIRIREQRIKPLTITLGCAILGWLVLLLNQAPSALVIFAGAGVLQMGFIFLVTLKWKISGHSTTVAGFAVFLLALFGPSAAPTLLTIPLVAWARVRLKRHEISQTIAGSLAGSIFMLATLLILKPVV